MPTFNDLISNADQRLTTARNSLTARTDALVAMRAAIDGGDTSITDANITAAITARDAAKSAVTSAEQTAAELRAERVEDDRVTALTAQRHPTGAVTRAAYDQLARVGREARTYNPGTDRDGGMFVRDLALETLGNWGARERLNAHMREEAVERGDMLTRSTTSTAPGAVVPQYLVDLYAPKARAGRHFADICTPHVLPETGMTVYIPRVTTGTTAGLQTTELTAVSETDYADENVAVPVRTNAGSNSISRQNVERSLGTEEFVLSDLLSAYHTTLDNQLINAASWGLAAVATTLAYTDGTPTAAELYSKVQEAGSAVESGLLDLPDDGVVAVMHSRRWKWLQGQMTTQWPFINGAPGNMGGGGPTAGYQAGVRGYLPDGGPVVTSNNVVTNVGAGTNEDQVYVAARSELHLWEDPKAPLFIRAEQPGAKSLRIDLVVYGYFAAYFDRYTGLHRKLTGTGLITPTF